MPAEKWAFFYFGRHTKNCGDRKLLFFPPVGDRPRVGAFTRPHTTTTHAPLQAIASTCLLRKGFGLQVPIISLLILPRLWHALAAKVFGGQDFWVDRMDTAPTAQCHRLPATTIKVGPPPGSPPPPASSATARAGLLTRARTSGSR